MAHMSPAPAASSTAGTAAAAAAAAAIAAAAAAAAGLSWAGPSVSAAKVLSGMISARQAQSAEPTGMPGATSGSSSPATGNGKHWATITSVPANWTCAYALACIFVDKHII